MSLPFVRYRIDIDIPPTFTEAEKDKVTEILSHLDLEHELERFLYDKILKYFHAEIDVEEVYK
jgi:hypothetical protein